MQRPKSSLSQPVLDRIARFSVHQADMLEILQLAADQWDERIEFQPARHGGWGLRHGTHTLDSSYNPDNSSEKFINAEDFTRTDLVVLIGSGSGSLPLALMRRLQASQVLIAVIEPNPSILLGMFSFNSEIERLDPTRIQFFSSLQSFKYYLIDLSHHGDRLSVLCTEAYRRSMPEEVGMVNEALKEAIPIMLGNRRTRTTNTRVQIKNLLSNIYRKDRCPSVFALKGELSGVPAVLVASGPSLDHNIAFLRKAPPGVLILCVNSSLKALTRNGIRPHMVFSNETADMSHDLAETKTQGKAPILALSDTGHPGVFAVPGLHAFMIHTNKWHYLAFSVEVTQQDVQGLHGGGCAANGMFAAALMFGCDPIALIGQDLAYSEGRVYANATDYGGLSLKVNGAEASVVDAAGTLADFDEAAYRKVTQKRTLVQVSAWDGQGQVMTSPNMNMFRLCFQEAGRHGIRERGVRLVNATEGGARIEGFEHQALTDFLAGLPAVDTSPEATIEDCWLRATPVPIAIIEAGMNHLAERIRDFITASQKVLNLLEKVATTLEDVGPDHPRFQEMFGHFNEARSAMSPIAILEAWIESEMNRISKDHPLDASPASAFTQGKRSLEISLQGAESLLVELETAIKNHVSGSQGLV